MPETKKFHPSIRVYTDESLKRTVAIQAATEGFRSSSEYVEQLLRKELKMTATTASPAVGQVYTAAQIAEMHPEDVQYLRDLNSIAGQWPTYFDTDKVKFLCIQAENNNYCYLIEVDGLTTLQIYAQSEPRFSQDDEDVIHRLEEHVGDYKEISGNEYLPSFREVKDFMAQNRA